ncbi:MAG: sensor histidine kinase [Luteimonas sp.]
MPQGLPRKLRHTFILQAVTASFAIVISVFVAGTIAKEILVSQRMHAEADNYWAGRALDPGYALPRTTTVRGYFVGKDETGGAEQRSPPPSALRAFASGMHDLPEGGARLLVDDTVQGRLYLVMRFDALDGVIRWTAALSALLALLAVYAVSWFTYRASARLVGPINQLARDVAGWDPRSVDADAFARHRSSAEGTEARQLGSALDDLARRMREHIQRERDFTRDTSHELRTPLTVIRVATDMMLSDPETSDRARRALSRMQRAGRDMETVIDAFLILARDGDVEPVTEEFDVHDVIDDEIDKARFALAQRPVKLVVTISASPRLHASPKVLALMFGHLLENACTFTEHGSIEVIVEHDRIIVRDTGIGMTSDVLEKVYAPFYRADPFHVAGKGMGLSIVRRLGDRFGWPVTLDSTPGHGTIATIGFGSQRDRIDALRQ